PAKKLLSQSSEKTNLLFGNVREINFTPHFSQAERVQVSNERQHRPFKTSSRLHYKQIVIKHPSFLKPSHGSCRRNRLRRAIGRVKVELDAVRLFECHQRGDVCVIGLLNAPAPSQRRLIAAPPEDTVYCFQTRSAAENQRKQSTGIETKLRL